jgi:hypothetical protein
VKHNLKGWHGFEGFEIDREKPPDEICPDPKQNTFIQGTPRNNMLATGHMIPQVLACQERKLSPRRSTSRLYTASMNHDKMEQLFYLLFCPGLSGMPV